MSTTVDTSSEIRPFQIEIPEEQIDDCAGASRRLAGTPRSSSKTDRSACTQGVQWATMRELARYWTPDYDFGRFMLSVAIGRAVQWPPIEACG